MSTHSVLALSRLLVLLLGSEVIFATGAVSAANDEQAPNAAAAAEGPDAAANLRAEKAALIKRLAEIDAQLDKIVVGQGVKILGLTLVDPTEELMKQYQLPEKYPGPIMVKAEEAASFFPRGMVAYEGCAFWIVEHPAYAFFFNKEKSPKHFPKTVRQLAEAIVACTVTPADYEKIWEDTRKACRERADALQDKPAERERLLKAAEAKMRPEDEGKYICRVVYHYPGTSGKTGTMTTYIRMSKDDLDHVQALLKK